MSHGNTTMGHKSRILFFACLSYAFNLCFSYVLADAARVHCGTRARTETEQRRQRGCGGIGGGDVEVS